MAPLAPPGSAAYADTTKSPMQQDKSVELSCIMHVVTFDVPDCSLQFHSNPLG